MSDTKRALVDIIDDEMSRTNCRTYDGALKLLDRLLARIALADDAVIVAMACKLLDIDPRDWSEIYRPDSAQHRAVNKARAAIAAAMRAIGGNR